ncbi:hypothetical protein GPECTOR_10g868 [Gonium pectorale]|uniref:Plastocyanin-like domain-containing protein n=1 Tax=Gonium pectorale TaxID=33097 RepID=A0A150GR06_GONPE|nr:hypothetical protein GPECTOR_10g868 [Gonium pectorale]|eukprot:KXZ52237.1 hypothetical protein GPECTOR_10g868 [Gonium pectorale]
MTLLALAILAGSAQARVNVTITRPPPPTPAALTIWGLAARGAYDPTGTNDGPGAAQKLCGAPTPEALNRKLCRPEADAWIPTIKEPRQVEVIFERNYTITAGQLTGVQIMALNLGVLDPPIHSVNVLLVQPGTRFFQTAPLYLGQPGDGVIKCPGFTTLSPTRSTFVLQPANISMLDWIVVGVRITASNGTVPKKGGLPSIAAVALLLRP